MKIGIIVYSQTGNTLLVADKLHKRLKQEKFDVNIERIEAQRDMKNSRNFNITKSTKIDKYDVIIFASYIEAFSLCPVMVKYLESIKSIKDKKVLAFVTQYFPYPWLGGNNGLKKIKNICHGKGADIEECGVINWSSKKREEKIDNLINDFCLYLKDIA